MIKKVTWYFFLIVILPAALIMGIGIISNISMAADENNTVDPDQTVFNIESVTKAPYGSAPDFSWKQDGKVHKFSELTKGKYVFLNFWGTWCPPCRREIPDIIQISNEMNGKGLIVVGIALERNAATAIDGVKRFAKAKNIPYMIFVDTKQELATAYGGINSVPTSFFLDKDSKIAQAFTGAASKPTFMNIIKNIMGN